MCNLGSCQENYIPAVKLKYRFDWSVSPGSGHPGGCGVDSWGAG